MTITALKIGIVAARRPALLQRTLASFQENVFSNFDVTQVYANVDPVFGDTADEEETVTIIKRFWPNAVVRVPETPSFGGAVKWLWSQLGGSLAFHLEDDWIVKEPIHPTDVTRLLSDTVSAVAPVCASHSWDGKRTLVTLKERKYIFGPFYRRIWPYAMGTTPKFLKGDFAVQASDLMIADLDPEKQMNRRFNPALFDLIQSNRCAYLPSKDNGELIFDIGRDWRLERKIVKTVQDGKSNWHQGD